MAWSYIPARLIGEKTSNFVDRQLEGLGVKNPLVREFGKRLAYVLPAAAVNIALADPVGKALTLLELHNNFGRTTKKPRSPFPN